MILKALRWDTKLGNNGLGMLETLIRAKPLSKLVGCDAFQFRENSKINWDELQNQGHYSTTELLLNMIRALLPRWRVHYTGWKQEFESITNADKQS